MKLFFKKNRRVSLLVFVTLPVFLFSFQLSHASTVPVSAPVPAEVLVVYNSNLTTDSDTALCGAVQDSKCLAQYYATARGIPAVNILGIPAPTVNGADVETISKNQYINQIETPIENYLSTTRASDGTLLRYKIRDIVLMRGIPLKISDGYGKSVDSAVTQLFTPYVTTATPWPGTATVPANPYFGLENSAFDGNYRFTSNTYTRGTFALNYIVTRLDGQSDADVKGMIDRSIAADTSGNKYFVVDDSATNIYYYRYVNLGAISNLQGLGYKTIYDGTSAVLTTNSIIASSSNETEPLIGYFSNGVHSQYTPMSDNIYYNEIANTNNRLYAPGAVAETFESYNAVTVTGNNCWGQNCISNFIKAGGSGGFGNVNEPYSSGMPWVSYWMPAYARGYTWGEAAYMSIPYMNWQTIVLGDPLMTINSHPFYPQIGAPIIALSLSAPGVSSSTSITVPSGTTVTISLNSTFASYCSFYTNGLLSSNEEGGNFNETLNSYLKTGSYQYSMTCGNTVGTATAKASAIVTSTPALTSAPPPTPTPTPIPTPAPIPAPTVSMSASAPGVSPSTSISVPSGTTVTLSWTSMNATSCNLYTNGVLTSNVNLSGTKTVTPATGSYQYSTTCGNTTGTVTAKTNVTVKDPIPAPTVSMSASAPGVSPSTSISVPSGTTVTLSWTSMNATSCNLYTNGVLTSNVNLSGTKTVTPATGSYQYSTTCGNTTGTVTAKTNVTVKDPIPAPTVSMSASAPGVSPSTSISVPSGTTVTLSWTSTNATSCNLYTNGVLTSNVNLSGTKTVTPTAGWWGSYTDYYYSVTCGNTTGTVTAKTNVTATAPIPAPTVSMNASAPGVSPSTSISVPSGTTVTLSWTSTNATSCNLYTNGVLTGSVNLSGTKTVTPTAGWGPSYIKYQYSVTCGNTTGTTVTASTTVTALNEQAIAPASSTLSQSQEIANLESAIQALWAELQKFSK